MGFQAQKNPFFSVLIPFFQAEQTLQEALDSVLTSTFTNFEVVLVDDGSNDNSLNIAKSFKNKDARIKIIESPHLGLVSALNLGLTNCQGSWVARFDSDDLMTKNRLESQHKEIVHGPKNLALIGGQVELFPPDDIRGGLMRYVEWLNEMTTFKLMQRDIFVEAPVSHSAATFNRAIVESLGSYRAGPFPEDYDLWLRLWEAGYQFTATTDTVLKWRHRSGRMTFNDSRYSVDSFRKLKIEMLLKTRLRLHKKIALIGSGKEGKIWSRELTKKGYEVTCWIEVNEKKIGQSIHNAPVIGYKDILSYQNTFDHVLVTVGIKGAREMIRLELDQLGLIEEKDYTAVS